jgi:hypothetical protein
MADNCSDISSRYRLLCGKVYVTFKSYIRCLFHGLLNARETTLVLDCGFEGEAYRAFRNTHIALLRIPCWRF